MKKSYRYEDLCKARAKWTSGVNVLVDHSKELKKSKKKIRRRVIWTIVLMVFVVFFALALYFGEAGGNMSMEEILKAAVVQFNDSLNDVDTSGQPNLIGGVLTIGILLFISLSLTLSAIVIRVKGRKYWSDGISQKKEILKIQNTYLYEGVGYDITRLVDTKAEMDTLKQHTMDLFAALFIFRENSNVYQRNWLAKLGIDRANDVIRGLDPENNTYLRLMLQGHNTNWYVQVAAMATAPIATAVSVSSSGRNQELNMNSEAIFTATYEASQYVNLSQEDQDFLRVVKEVMTYWPGNLAALVQNNK